jgi:uncharacterized protein (DUF427 family)
MSVANSRRRQPNPHFVEEDDEIIFSEMRSQRKKVRFDARGLQHTTLIVVLEPQIHLPNSFYVEEDDFVDEKFQEDEFVDEESNK